MIQACKVAQSTYSPRGNSRSSSFLISIRAVLWISVSMLWLKVININSEASTCPSSTIMLHKSRQPLPTTSVAPAVVTRTTTANSIMVLQVLNRTYIWTIKSLNSPHLQRIKVQTRVCNHVVKMSALVEQAWARLAITPQAASAYILNLVRAHDPVLTTSSRRKFANDYSIAYIDTERS